MQWDKQWQVKKDHIDVLFVYILNARVQFYLEGVEVFLYCSWKSCAVWWGSSLAACSRALRRACWDLLSLLKPLCSLQRCVCFCLRYEQKPAKRSARELLALWDGKENSLDQHFSNCGLQSTVGSQSVSVHALPICQKYENRTSQVQKTSLLVVILCI